LFIEVLHLLYSQVARARRRFYERREHVRRRLHSPVISIGNLTVGGSGKTPLAAEIARMLLDMGERPAILSRGYARKRPTEGAIVVSDGRRVQSDVEQSGDEPLMLAKLVPQACVLVSPSRYVSGRIAESRLGCTVHVLDDGFQHFELMRDIDLLIAPDSLDDVRTLPAGRFREPLDAAKSADALLVEVGRTEALRNQPGEIDRLGVSTAFEFMRRIAGPPADSPAFAFAGIARPDRFFSDLEAFGWHLTGRKSFPDHHHYSARDVERIRQQARESGASVILTTEKDAVRLTQLERDPAIVAIPLEIEIDRRFRTWLTERLRNIRAAA
jgi:tetraacyldisaccharide 4'-kinase